MTDTVRHDVALIGAGPIGLEVAVALKQAGVDYVHLERGQIGQTITWFPPLMRFFSSPDRIAIAGVPIPRRDGSKCSREEYLGYLRAIVQQFDLEVRTYEPVEQLDGPLRGDGGFRITTMPITPRAECDHNGRCVYEVDRVVLAIGDTHEPKRLEIPGEDLPQVDHAFGEPHRYFGRKVLVVGGRNSAVEAALRCYQMGAEVALSYRRADFLPDSIKYWLLPEMQNRIKRGEIAFYPETMPAKIEPGRVTLEKVDGGEEIVETDFLLVLIGFHAEQGLFERVGVELQGDERIPAHNEQTMETNVPGVFIAGTATAGTQGLYSVFLETCHVHAQRIAAVLSQGSVTELDTPEHDLPES